MAKAPRMTDNERILIERLVGLGESDTAIARMLRRDVSTVTRYRNMHLGMPPGNRLPHAEFVRRNQLGQFREKPEPLKTGTEEEALDRIRAQRLEDLLREQSDGMVGALAELGYIQEKD